MAKRRSHGEGSIYKSRGRWVAAVTVEGPTGAPVRRRRMKRTQAEALKALDLLRKEAVDGLIGSERLSVKAFLESWQTDILPARDVGSATKANYKWAIGRHIIPAVGSVRLDKLRAEHVDQLLRDRAGDGMARNSLRIVRTVLVLALTHAERRNMVSRNAARLSVLPPAPKRERRSLTPLQARVLLDCLNGYPMEAAYILQLTCGLRPGEVLALGWGDLDLTSRTLNVRHGLKREGTRYVLGPPKTPKSERSLNLPKMAVEALHRRRRAQSADRLRAGPSWVNNDFVFTTSIGTYVDPANFRKEFRKATEAAGLGPWSPHELRHSAISLLSAAGVRLEEVADLVGQVGTRMTAEVYRHPVKPTVSVAVGPMDRMLG